MNTAKYAIFTLALAGLVAPSAALAVCNGVGNSCSSTYSQHQQYMPQSQYQYGYQPSYSGYSQYSGYGSYGYSAYSQPIYFPVYNTTFPQYGQYGGYSYGGYGYGNYGYGQGGYGGYYPYGGGYSTPHAQPMYLGY